MTGFEIAGIVLGGFPILVEPSKPLSRYYQGAGRWWRFKRDFMTLVSTVEDQSIAFSQNLRLLLAPVDIDPETKAILLQDPGSKLWHDPVIQAKLKKRIESQYISWFWKQLMEMRDALDELYGMLPIDQDGKVNIPRATTVDYELFRLKQSFSTRSDSHIAAQATRSTNFGDQFPQSSTMEVKVRKLLHLQSEAKKLSHAFRDGWNCLCEHQCGVRLDWRPLEAGTYKEPSLKLLLEIGAGMKETRVQMIAEGDIESPSSPSVGYLGQMANLRVPLHQELAPMTFEQRLGRKGLASFAETTTSTLVTPAVPVDLGTQRGRERKKLTKTDKSQVRTNRSCSPARKPVNFSHASSGLDLASLSHPQAWIRDTCSFIKSEPIWDGQQYLKAEKDAIAFSIESRDQPSIAKSEIKDLEALYGGTLRLSDRLKIGVEIALTILGLGTSCWIPRGWDRREILVLKGPKTSTKPFFRHQSLSSTIKEPMDDPRQHTELTMFSLGVILLELLYQETLEQQPSWESNCVDGEPNDFTHLCTAEEWQSTVEARYGVNISGSIELCLKGGFLTDVNLDNSEFLEEVIDTVISPIEKVLSKQIV
ncbi:hypothetical protein NCS52_01105000 [Fusarium sp. LHS14.1]|nr:hypothetical protein NCS52_01105000 [Fusarium sp. LHS14.1]